MEVLERSDTQRVAVKRYKRIEDDPKFWENNPVNISDLSAEEILARIRESVRDIEEGRCVTLEEFEQYFREKYGIW